MWGECLRLALSGAGAGGAEVLFWLLRDFLQDSPVLRRAFLRAARAI